MTISMNETKDNLIRQPVYGEGGKGGGGSAHTPTESANTLQSKAIARVVDLISEGEIVGLYTGEGEDGKALPLKAVYFDDIPVQSVDGTEEEDGTLTGLNFDGVDMEERVGLPDQEPLEGFSEVESEITINQQVTDASPVLFTVTDDDVDAVRIKFRLPALYEQTDKGDLVATTLQFKVEVQPSGGSYSEILNDTVSGKNTSPYERQHRIGRSELSLLGTFPYVFRVSRITPDSDKASRQQDLFVNSYTEIQESKLSYPDSALVGIRVNSELFSGRVPKRSYFVRGIRIQIPANYFPETRLYNRAHGLSGPPDYIPDGTPMLDESGEPIEQTWNGSFYTAWSNNPAWVLYDVLTNERYGLGEFITPNQVDCFCLYTIGRYCDELVDTGLNNETQEPRFVFNGVINTRRDAYDVINAITSTFRGMNFWSAGGVTAVADSPKDPTRLVTRANIIGQFEYSGTALRSRHSAALVSWNDPNVNYEQAIEVVEDPVLRERFGWREIEIAAFGTTSRGQAHRLGKWVLDSEQNESETLTFTGGFDMADIRPGDIIQVADPARQGIRRGGRIVQYTAGSPGTIEVDHDVKSYPGDTLLVMNVNGAIESLAIEDQLSGRTVTLKDTPTADLQPNSVFIHRGTALEPEEWRVLSVRETDQHQFEVTCLTYDKDKYDRIEEGNLMDPEPVSFLPAGPVKAPTDLTVFESIRKEKNSTSLTTQLDISWKRPDDPRVGFYRVEVARPDADGNATGNWEFHKVTPHVHCVVENAADGLWGFRITAGKNDNIAAGSTSAALEVTDHPVLGLKAPPANVQNLTAHREFDKVTLRWDQVDDLDLAGYEVRRGPSWGDEQGNPVSGQTEVLVTTFNNSHSALVSTTAEQTYHVRAIDTLNNYSSEVASIQTSIKSLPAVTGLHAYQTDSDIRVIWDAPNAIENIQYEIRVGAQGGTWGEATQLRGKVASPGFRGPLDDRVATTYTVHIKAFVTLSEGQPSYGDEATVDITFIPANVGLQLISRTEEPLWPALGSSVSQRFQTSGPGVDDTYTEGSLIRSLLHWNDHYIGNKRISGVRNGSFLVTLNVSSNGVPEGNILGVGGTTGDGAMTIGFDGTGDLIWRVGNGRKQWFQYDTTSLLHFWQLREPTGTRVDLQGSNDLTVNGTITAGKPANSPFAQPTTTAFDGSSSTYLSGTDISLAGKDWSLIFWFAPDDTFDWSGQLFELGSGATLTVELVDSTTLRATVSDSSGAVSVDSTVLTPLVADTWYMGLVLFEQSTLTLTVGIGRANTNTGTVDSGGLVDTAGTLRLGRNFAGSMEYVLFFERLLDISTSQELEQMEASMIAGSTGNMRLVIPNSEIPTDTDFTLLFDIDKGDVSATDGSRPAHGRVWIDDDLYEADTEYGEGLSRLRRATSGRFAAAAGLNDGETGNYNGTLSNVTVKSDLSYWHDQLIYDPLEIVDESLTLTEGAVYGVYDFPLALSSVKAGRLSATITASSIAADALDISDATMLIDDAGFLISETIDGHTPQVKLFIDVNNTGTFIPFETGTYQFQSATMRAELTRGPDEITRPAIDHLRVHFVELPVDWKLKATTTDATLTTLTTDGEAASASNIPTIPDNFVTSFRGVLAAHEPGASPANWARYTFEGSLSRGTGAAQTVVSYFSIRTEHEEDESWNISIEADTTIGGLALKVTGAAATTVEWLCDLDFTE